MTKIVENRQLIYKVNFNVKNQDKFYYY